jgi:hypoxanthine phosphoribosyltransferase
MFPNRYNNYIGIAIIFIIIVRVVANFLNRYVDQKIRQNNLPDWFDKNLIPYFHHKKNKELNIINHKHLLSVTYFTLLLSLYSLFSRKQFNIYTSWNDIEQKIQKNIYNIQQKHIKYDGIIGIKSGGAFIANYYSKILNIPVYGYIKIERYGNNNVFNFLNGYWGKTQYSNIKYTHITKYIRNKHILLVDDGYASGKTIQLANNYLKEHHYVSSVHITVLHCSPFINDNITCHNSLSATYPWGFG